MKNFEVQRRSFTGFTRRTMSSSSESAVSSIASSLQECENAANASHSPCIAAIDRMLNEIDTLRTALGMESDNETSIAIDDDNNNNTTKNDSLSAAERTRIIDSLKAMFGETKAKEFQRKDESAAVARLNKVIVEKASYSVFRIVIDLFFWLSPVFHELVGSVGRLAFATIAS